VATGSLLGVAISRQRTSFPVGKVEMILMYPMDFEEVLLANGKKDAAVQSRLQNHDFQRNMQIARDIVN
jgi:predicted AAA+ superfamily ATPase